MRGPDSYLIPRARKLRRESTLAEARLWEQLRGRKLAGFKFVRQAPVGPFIVDFLCKERLFIVEVDGATHLTDQELANDRRRSSFFEAKGYTVLRVTNSDIIHGLDQVVDMLREKLTA